MVVAEEVDREVARGAAGANVGGCGGSDTIDNRRNGSNAIPAFGQLVGQD